MTLRLNGSTSGYTEIDAPAVAGNNTLVLPANNGSLGQVLATNGSGALSWADNNPAIQETAVALGTNWATMGPGLVIPSTAKRIVATFHGMSTNIASQILVRVGQLDSILTTGYSCRITGMATNGTIQQAVVVNGFPLDVGSFVSASNQISGQLTLTRHDSTKWIATGTFLESTTSAHLWVTGFIGGLTGTGDLRRLELTAGGTATFDTTSSVKVTWES